MTSTVKITMFPCENSTDIEVRLTGEEEFVVEATGTCPKALKFIDGLGPLSITDLTDKKESKIFHDFLASDMSANCLVLPGVISAAWVEAGMIARSMTKKGTPLAIQFDKELSIANKG